MAAHPSVARFAVSCGMTMFGRLPEGQGVVWAVSSVGAASAPVDCLPVCWQLFGMPPPPLKTNNTDTDV